MFPLIDNNPSRSFPIVNALLIAVNVFCFCFELSIGSRHLQQFYNTFGLIPNHFVNAFSAHQFGCLFSSMFVHGGLIHLVTNMWVLFIFGDNVEDRLGHLGYFFFYLLCGVVAMLVQIFSGQDASLPIVGASGAIAGVLGAYLVLFPEACIISFVPLGIIPLFYPIPAIVYAGLWLIFECCAGVLCIAHPEIGSNGAFAYWAHLGGFVTGFALVRVFADLFDYRDWYPDEYAPW